jgi:hypothetical protein
MLDGESHQSNNGGHTSDERNTAREFSTQDAAEALRRGHQARVMADADEATAGSSGGESDSAAEPQSRSRKTRGGTHEQHTAAGKKGGSRIRQLIELGYKYEQEHGIGPGQSKRSKLTKRTADAGTD